ncbi:putative ATP-dependent carboligase [Candidatus Methanoperedens nitroreducens]|uniref:Putative ATP-dependent carboligase n=1 Tax=Candidatus Methanoperedens nitratireducens TaxID=1392998 RepID=A0A062UZQ4_9EURY|nr:ATP-grasp domain-containing protein [Candidatus Methanoperedens nitroreducens]KCZ70652.1 putative ATP-dependent carboligase [Candidatus Methanoperedens nitroreducens]MDJ1420505.1 ATP-grasp domain-containing protein [Candidatus Methanoperedens sp.]
MKILVIGKSTRGIVCSAKRAGYTVYALDQFGDVDMRRCADKAQFLDNVNRIPELVNSFGEFDAIILGPGFERLKFKNILNNRLKIIEEVSDKLSISKRFKSMGIPHPDTEPLDKASGLKFPLMVKPRSGSGGIQNTIVRNEDELTSFKARSDAGEFIAQEFVNGIPCSASLIGTGDDVAIVALNEQLIGNPWLTRLPFAYCGNITPFSTGFNKEMIEYAKQIALEFRLSGSNGVDFLLTEKDVVAIEVNPRFQGSIDTVELSTGMNIFDAHVRSFEGQLPESREPVCFAAKAIMYANKKTIIYQKLSDRLIKYMDNKHAADIPQPGWVVQPDEPIATVLETGKIREGVLEKVKRYAHDIKIMTEV